MMEAETENQQRYDYIDALMQRARKGRVIERTTVVRFEPPNLEQWRQRAIAELETYQDKRLWGEANIRCGRCKREWDAWLAANPVSEPLAEWIELARKTVMEKRWI